MKTITFLVCGLDSRSACCSYRHVVENQPVSLCGASSVKKPIKDTVNVILTFDTPCAYRAEFKVNMETKEDEPGETS